MPAGTGQPHYNIAAQAGVSISTVPRFLNMPDKVNDGAIGVLKAARVRGIAVPSALAVLGFDDVDAADYMGLSTVSQSLVESGRVAARLLIDRIQDAGRPLQRVHLEVRLIERETT